MSVVAEENGKKNNSVVIVSIIAVIAVLAAGFFFLQYSNEQAQTEELQKQLMEAEKTEQATEAKIDEAKQAAGGAMEEAKESAGLFLQGLAAEVVKTAEEVQAIIAAQNAEIETLNQQVSTLDHTTQCQELLEVGPKNEDTWYTTEYSDDFQQDICKYYNDIQNDLNDAEEDGDEDEIEALEQALEIAEPYYDNFVTQCSDIYDVENCEFIE